MFLKEKIELLHNISTDFLYSVNTGAKIPNTLIYKVASYDEDPEILQSARLAALEVISKSVSPIKKLSFDTRRIDQQHTRNPRTNLQYWNRTDQFIDNDMQRSINIFAKLIEPLEQLKNKFGAEAEWHDSYTRILYDAVVRVLRIKQADLDIFRPSIKYLEQLVFARYRLSMDELSKISQNDFIDAVIKKDEALLKRGSFLNKTQEIEKPSKNIVIDSNAKPETQQNILNAIFGSQRRSGEKKTTRTITIKICDELED